MLDITLNSFQQVKVTCVPVTKTGTSAKLDGAPIWTVTGGDSTLVVADDGLSADLISSDTPGDTTYLVDGDADLGAGVVDVQDTILLHVTGVNFERIGFAAGVPEAK